MKNPRSKRRDEYLNQMISKITHEFNIDVSQAEEIYLAKNRFIYKMFKDANINSMDKSITFLYNNFGKFAIDIKRINIWKKKRESYQGC